MHTCSECTPLPEGHDSASSSPAHLVCSCWGFWVRKAAPTSSQGLQFLRRAELIVILCGRSATSAQKPASVDMPSVPSSFALTCERRLGTLFSKQQTPHTCTWHITSPLKTAREPALARNVSILGRWEESTHLLIDAIATNSIAGLLASRLSHHTGSQTHSQ